MGDFNLWEKSLGPEGYVPEKCPCCMVRMRDRGWVIWGHMITCNACRTSFLSEILMEHRAKKKLEEQNGRKKS